MSAFENRPAQSDAAVIDVGSNSVRLVLYRLDGRAIWSIFNEKVLAGLGRDLTRTGALAPAGIETALNALRRFRALIDASRPCETRAMAQLSAAACWRRPASTFGFSAERRRPAARPWESSRGPPTPRDLSAIWGARVWS
jgi:hypothetical protein